MYTHIMNNPAAMANLKERNGLNVKQNSNATSEFIRIRIVQREVREVWFSIKKTFEDSYSNCKMYDFLYINSFIENIPTMTPGRLKKLHDSALEGVLEDYLLRRMGIKKESLDFRNTKLTA